MARLCMVYGLMARLTARGVRSPERRTFGERLTPATYMRRARMRMHESVRHGVKAVVTCWFCRRPPNISRGRGLVFNVVKSILLGCHSPPCVLCILRITAIVLLFGFAYRFRDGGVSGTSVYFGIVNLCRVVLLVFVWCAVRKFYIVVVCNVYLQTFSWV